MNKLWFADNIVRLRHQKGITQDELAGFIGVTKASVSKWETRQSLPDILLLPLLASYFDVTVDELLGYEPQMSKEQIKKCYHDLAEDFVSLPFDEVMRKCRSLVKEYYSCYPFLVQICILWLNHAGLAEGQDGQMEVLNSISDLCGHILESCKDMGICGDAVRIRATIDLQKGNTMEVIETLEDMLNPYRLSSYGDTLLTQAYLLRGEKDKADGFTQIVLFNHLVALLNNAMQYLQIHIREPELCETMIGRIDKVIEAFDLGGLNPNAVAGFCYQAAVNYCANQDAERALDRLERFTGLAVSILKNSYLHGDEFFNRLDEWFENSPLGTETVRDKRLIAESVMDAFANPAFALLADTDRYKRMKKFLCGEGEML